MQTRRLGRSGLQVSTLGLGTLTWGIQVDDEGARDQLTAFVAAGGTLIDTAPTYGNGAAETMIGELLGQVIAREDVVLVTKAGLRRGPEGRVVDASRRALLASLDASLARLGTDHVDLWLAHAWDPHVPIAETLGALEYAVGSGRARYVGVSNYTGWQVARAATMLEAGRVPLVCNEIEHSLLQREGEHEVLPAAVELGFGVLAWAPLGRGVLTGKYRGGIPPQSRASSRSFPNFLERFLDERAYAVTEAVVTAARGLDVTPAEVALAWARDTPGVTATVVGARTMTQLTTAVRSDALGLPAELRSALDEVSA
ncbi:MAG: aldo/keto reductase [Actinomycetales bacterium]|nr:aldo/keto reductase [Actinomycetales bacterium]